MSFRTVLVVATLALLTAFVAVNWTALSTPATLSLGVVELQAPIGLALMIVCGVLCGLFLFLFLVQQAGVIVEARRTARELKAHRELADKAEASRFTELRVFLENELLRAETRQGTAARELAERLDRLQASLQADVAESGRVMSAYVGEVDDKLDRRLPAPRG